jgi:hypothetical protein
MWIKPHMKHLFLLLSLLSPILLLGQDNHYWSQNFGARSSMLSGAVTAGVRDNSAVFYNPAGIGLDSTQSFSLNANLYRIHKLRILLASSLPIKHPKWSASFALIMRHFDNERIRYRHEQFSDIFPDAFGNEEFIGNFEYENNVIEQWGGLAFAYSPNEHLSIGLTTFIAYRNQKFRFGYNTRAITVDPNNLFVSSLVLNDEIVIDNFRLLWKAGLAYQTGIFKLGLTLTAPSLNVVGFGNVSRELSYYNYPSVNNINDRSDLLGNDRQQNLKSTFKTPWAVGAGFEFEFAKHRLMLNTEFFSAISNYRVLNTESRPFIRPSGLSYPIPQDEFLTVLASGSAVMNFGFGHEWSFTDKMALLWGFRTDFAAEPEYTDGFEMYLNNITFDLYHVTLGYAIKLKKSGLNFGLDYAFSGTNAIETISNFDQPERIYYALPTEQYNSSFRYNGLSLILGFTQEFGKGDS